MEQLHFFQIIFDRRTILKAEDDTYFAGLLGFKNIGSTANRLNQIAMGTEVTLPLTNIFKRLLGVFPVGNGDVNGIQT